MRNPAQIQYRVGDATAPDERPGVICHVCNDVGAWGRGFVVALSRRWRLPEFRYRSWHARYTAGKNLEIPFALGSTQIFEVENEIWVANMIAQHGLRHNRQERPPIRYDALEACLNTVAAFASTTHATLHMPRIGCGLAGGKWEHIEPILQDVLAPTRVCAIVYDL